MANILVVDDELGIRDLLSEILSDEGHVVEAAEDAAHARSLRAEVSPDLVLLDIWMPDTDGVSLLKEWRSGGVLTMPVIMMSGHATIDTAVEATRLGASGFLEKPITLQKLLSAVNLALRQGIPNLQTNIFEPIVTSAAPSISKNPIRERTRVSPEVTGVLGEAQRIFNLDGSLRVVKDAFEREYFSYHLYKELGSMTRVAAKTGLERTHLYRKLKQLGISIQRRRGGG